MDLTGKVAIVTGASAGIGAATVKVLLDAGMKVVGIARRKERIEKLSENSQGRLFALKVDLRNTQEILDAFKWIEENVGPIHILINNAGTGTPTPIATGNIDAWKTVLETNFLSNAVTCREAIRSMRENNIDGYIINVNSIAGRYDAEGSIGGNIMYSSSKRALMTLTENIRLELARLNSKIRITSLIPGTVKTEIMQANGYSQEHSNKVYSQIPYLTCEDVADTILYLLLTPPRVQVSELVVRPTGENFEKLMTLIRKDA